MGMALAKIEEDPTFTVRTDELQVKLLSQYG
jgi:hypothetical protein